ncbi:MAG: bacteriohemerythrin [Gammaproteobacteria bacterium]|nr:bacteriohemerythrin [Gammaproteobacteria bacterium]
MNLKENMKHRFSFKTKLSILVTMAVLMVVTALGIYFDRFIKDGFLESTRSRLIHGYDRLSDNLQEIERDLKEGISFVKTDEATIASIELINKYEDVENYNVFLIDEEKKSIAKQLLSRVKLSFNDDIVLYGNNHELVAFVAQDDGGYRLNYISYENSEPQLFWRYEHQRDFTLGEFKFPPNILYKHKNLYDPNLLFKTSIITYQRIIDRLSIKSHQSIIDEGTGDVVGHIEMSKILDESYFKKLSETLDMDISYSFESADSEEIGDMKDILVSQELDIKQTEENYTAKLFKEIPNGNIYFIVKLNKQILNAFLNNNRSQFLLILMLVAIFTLILMRIILNRGIDRPLSALMEQIRKIESMDYSESDPIVSGDELEDISININRLALTVQEREASLKSSMEEQKYLLSQIRMLLDSTAEAIYGLDLNGLCTFANPACVKLLGVRSVDDLIGKNMHKLTHHTRSDGSHYHEGECPIFEVLQTGNGIHVDSDVLWRADGTSFKAEYWSYPIIYDGTITGAVVTFLDITERMLAEEGLRRAKKMDAIGQLSGGIAHDFNNILGVILGNLELMERQVGLNEKTHKRISSMKKASRRAADLTKQLLSFSRNKSGEFAVCDINKLIIGMDNLITRSLTPEIEVKSHFDDELWRTEIDPGEFEDALLNLCINARDAIGGHGYLTIETNNTVLDSEYCSKNIGAIPGDYVELSVIDSGAGITPEQMEHIFEPFYTTKDQGKGTGLGLSMVFGFVKRAGGHIRCSSEVGVGTTFRIYLPRSLRDVVLIRTEKQDMSLPHGTETILIVDDDSGILELAKELLESQGYYVLTAGSGGQALQILTAEKNIDLLFSDVVMPGGINGYELAEKAKLIQPEIKILLTSGYTKKGAVTNSQLRFAASLLNKPYSLMELSQRIRLILGDTAQVDNAPSAKRENSKNRSLTNPIKWSDAFSVGIEAIDDDHRKIIEILNTSKQAALLNDDTQCDIILERLVDYTRTHFNREEVVMAACGYPGLENHIQAHQFLSENVEKMKVQLDRGELHITDMTGFIRDWLFDHILYMDRAFADDCMGKDEQIAQALNKAGPAPGENIQRYLNK